MLLVQEVTEINKIEWIRIFTDQYERDMTFYAKVPGGRLYRHEAWPVEGSPSITMTFVPEMEIITTHEVQMPSKTELKKAYQNIKHKMKKRK